MKNMLKDAAILFAITLVAGLLLGVVNEVTKEPIALAKEKAKQEACQTVFSTAASFERQEIDTEAISQALIQQGLNGVDVDEMSFALDNSGKVLGVVITVTDHEGYGGDIQFSMGITNDGLLNGISLLSISETAGLGMEAENILVPQFTDKEAMKFSYTKTGSVDPSEIDAISGATITTKAVVNGVNAGIAYYEMLMEGGIIHE